ncbi:hypothetical protein GIB67_011038 [Kingdonia uniflora]|uniref:Regulator of Vps4 activity in the MVB pathway protein n=1 Tax=Kingdonia uniflora TaxID=39325 RepID=A0A7J7L6M2_9MAGN|nr:hypothetical protein GIB67_011038 [Kingdonia uniflora]
MMSVKCHEKFKNCIRKVKKTGKSGFSRACPYETAMSTMIQGMDMAILFSQMGTPNKTSLKLAVARTKLLKNKKGSSLVVMKRELAQLLEAGQERTARIRVEHVVREENSISAYDLIEIYCELIVARLPIIESQKTCPNDLKEAICSIIFASPRCADLPELQDVRKHFTAKYGKEFISSALELRPNCGVSRLMIEKLSVQAPNGETKIKILTAIAREHNVNWNPEAFEEKELKPREDLLNGPSTVENSSKILVEPPNVRPPPTQQRVHETYVRFPEKNVTGSSPSPNLSNPPSASNISTSSTSHPELRNSESASRGKDYGDSYPENGNYSSINRRNTNMEFKDAASAARVAAESAERASMAARAAVELSNLENVTRGSSVEPKHDRFESYRGEKFENSSKPRVVEETSSPRRIDPRVEDRQRYRNMTHTTEGISDDKLVTKRRSGLSASRTSVNSIDDSAISNLQKENAYSQRNSDEEVSSSDWHFEKREKGDIIGEAVIKEQSRQTEVESEKWQGHFIDSRDEGLLKQHKKSLSSHSHVNADDDGDDYGIEKQYKKSSSSHSHLRIDDDGGEESSVSVIQADIQKGNFSTVYDDYTIGKQYKKSPSSHSRLSTDDDGGEESSVSTIQADVQKGNSATVYDDYGSEDDGGLGSPVPFFSENITTVGRKEQERESPKEKSGEYSNLFVPPSSLDFSENVTKETVPTQSNPAYDDSDGTDSEIEKRNNDLLSRSPSPPETFEKIRGSTKSTLIEKEVVESFRGELKSEDSFSRKKETAKVNFRGESRPSPRHIRSPRTAELPNEDPFYSAVVEEQPKPLSTSRVRMRNNFSPPRSHDDKQDLEVPNYSISESEQELILGKLTGGFRNKGYTRPPYNRDPPKDTSTTSITDPPISLNQQTYGDSYSDEAEVLPRKNISGVSSGVSRRTRDAPVTSQRRMSSSKKSYDNHDDQALSSTRAEGTGNIENSEFSRVDNLVEQKLIKHRARRQVLASDETRDSAQLGSKSTNSLSNIVASENMRSSKSSSLPVKTTIRDNSRFSRDKLSVEQEPSKPAIRREVLDHDENPKLFQWVSKVEESYNPRSTASENTETSKSSSSPLILGNRENSKLSGVHLSVDQEPVKPRTRKEISVRDENPKLSQLSSKVEESSNTPNTEASKNAESPKASNLSEESKSKENPQKRAPHVHPKLPDYEAMAAHFASLRSNVRSGQ